MRVADMARIGGISAQQVRNYGRLGLLPPVERTAGGYRVFTDDHAEALLVSRRLAEGHGWEGTRTIMRAVHDGDLGAALAALDAGHAELDRERADVATALRAFGTVVGSGSALRPVPRGGLRIGEVARAVRVRTPVLRLWERRGLLRPARETGTGYRVFDEAELRAAHVVALLRRGGYAFPIIEAVLDELRRTGGPEKVRAELARREHELRRRSLLRLRASAALYAYLERRGSIE
ncbi:MAG TPA: MerR family transcriptional regulator [Candidatus Dormibacteraeota bacterium]|nr:MerR family transcriptional regulator [Candidatus Dormibacteraeota bacterium]